ncbi:MAG TPA: MerR family transcriptional regulator, partial [Propionibacteriaceae bacterium]|nr:MerR family transcriptional regulator [Propionibacteriaceae bacterium]
VLSRPEVRRREMYTIKRASEMVGVPVATLRAWQRRYGVVNPGRSASGYRLYGAADIAVLRHMQALVASGWSPKEAAAAAASTEADFEREPAELPRDEPPRGRSRRAGTGTLDLVAAAAALDPVAITWLLDDHFAKGSFEQVVDGWLLPELERLGQAWADGAVSVAGEHLAAAAVQRRLSAAFDAAALDTVRSPLLLTGLPPGCRHELGILAFATAARRQGLAVVHLGPDLPLRDWLTAADRHQTDAVVIAVPTLSDVAPALEIVEGFAGRRELVAIGGRHQDAVLEATGRLAGRSAVPLGQSIAHAASQLRDRLGSL